MSVHRGYAAVSFGQVHYRYAGAGDKPVLILLHQTPSSSEMYVDLMQELSSTFRVLAPDTPGMGMSDPIDGDLSIGGLTEGIAEFLDEIGIDRCFVFGHHTGASIAAELTARYPKLVEAVAMSGPTLLDDELKSTIAAHAKVVPAARDGSHFHEMWNRISGKDADAAMTIIERETINGLLIGELYPATYAAVIDHDFQAAAEAISCRTLVFAGTLDPLFGQLDASFAVLKQGSREVVEGARTFICETHTDEVAGLLRDFFAKEFA